MTTLSAALIVGLAVSTSAAMALCAPAASATKSTKLNVLKMARVGSSDMAAAKDHRVLEMLCRMGASDQSAQAVRAK